MTDVDEIWRYMDLAKYVGLLSRGLFFAQASAFSDSFKWVGMSCWHISPTENAALWDMYVPLGMGIALRSTPKQVVGSVKGIGRSGQCRAVEYSDYKERPTGSDPVNLLSHKRQEFAFEQELRFFIELRGDEIDAVEMMARTMKSRTTRHVAVGPVRPLVWTSGGGYGSSDRTLDRRAAPGGTHWETAAAADIIEAVYLTPSVSYQVRRAVIDVTEKFGVSRKLIREATMSMVPPDRLEFHDPMNEWKEPIK